MKCNFWIYRELKKLKRLLRALLTQGELIMGTQEEMKAQLAGIGDTLNKASGEIVAKIAELTAALDSVSPEVQAIVDDLSAKAKALDDIVPDAT